MAWGFVAASSFILAGGVVLFWIRRREPAVAKRDWCNTACFASVAVLAQVSAFLGQSLPCWAFFALNYALAAFIPGLIAARFFGLYARYARQAEAVRAPMSGPADPTDAREPSKTSRASGGWCSAYSAWLAAVLLRYKLDAPHRNVLVALVTVGPWSVYAILRFATSPYRCESGTGCMFDWVDVFMATAVTVCSYLIGIPAFWYLSHVPDTLHLRFEVLRHLAVWPPMVVWTLTDLALPRGQHVALHAIYGLVVGCTLTLVSTMWIPALQSFPSRFARGRTGAPPLLSSSNPSEGPRSEVQQAAVTSRAIAPPHDGPILRAIAMHPLLKSSSVVAGCSPRLGSLGAPAMPTLDGLVCVAARFLHPVPTNEDIFRLLRSRATAIRDSGRATDLLCALLLATNAGRALLFETLRLDLSAEFLGFIVDSEAYRATADAWLPFVILTDSSDAGEASTATSARLYSRLRTSLTLLVARYVELGAPHYIAVDPADATVLLRAMVQLREREADSTAALVCVESVLVALANAELRAFEAIIDPVQMRMRTRTDLFDAWAAATLQEVSRPAVDELEVEVAA